MNGSDVKTDAAPVTGVDAEFEKRTKAFHGGANWFYWIAGFSLVNSIVGLFNGEWGFIIGLGITQLFDGLAMAIAEEAGEGAWLVVRGVALLFNLFVISMFVLFGWLANKKHGWAFITGLVLYTFDGLLFLLVGDWLSIAFHVLAFIFILGGYISLVKLREMESTPGTGETVPLVAR